MARVAFFNDTHVRCSECETWKPRELFTRDASRPSGTIAYCRPCAATRRRARYANDADYHASELERRKRQYHADPQTWNARRVAWAKANPDKRRAAEERHRDRHREALRVKWTKYRLTRRAPGKTREAWLTTLRSEPCSYCGGPAGTIDHITPVSLGGTSTRDNLAAACQPCNSRKGATPLLFALTRMNADQALEFGLVDEIRG